MILSYLDPNKAASILSALPHTIQAEVAKRIATMDRVSPDVLREVERVLERKLSTLASEDYTTAGGIDSVVEILNNVDRGTEKTIIEALEEEDPELAEEIKNVCSYSKISYYSTTVRFKSYARGGQHRACKSSQVSRLRSARENFQEHVQTGGEPTPRRYGLHGSCSIERCGRCTAKIVNIIRKLEEAGEIVVARSGEDELIV